MRKTKSCLKRIINYTKKILFTDIPSICILWNVSSTTSPTQQISNPPLRATNARAGQAATALTAAWACRPSRIRRCRQAWAACHSLQWWVRRRGYIWMVWVAWMATIPDPYIRQVRKYFFVHKIGFKQRKSKKLDAKMKYPANNLKSKKIGEKT